jgi:hypothetical protein
MDILVLQEHVLAPRATQVPSLTLEQYSGVVLQILFLVLEMDILVPQEHVLAPQATQVPSLTLEEYSEVVL